VAEREKQRVKLCDSLELGIGGLHAELAELRAALERSEKMRLADAASVQQANALATGSRFKVGKLEADLQRAVARADVAEQQLAAMESRLAAAEREAGSERRRAAAEVGPARDQLDAERRARIEAERAGAAHKEKHEAALKACRQAGDECERVRRRNETLEREVESLKQRLGEQTGGSGPSSLNEVFDDLAAMERLVPCRLERNPAGAHLCRKPFSPIRSSSHACSHARDPDAAVAQVQRSCAAGLDDTTGALRSDKGGAGAAGGVRRRTG
jgi:chromosome segregation ATPase